MTPERLATLIHEMEPDGTGCPGVSAHARQAQLMLPVIEDAERAGAGRLREALGRIAARGCDASAASGEAPVVADRCLDYEYREDKPTGDPDVDRCDPCLVRTALDAEPGQPRCPVHMHVAGQEDWPDACRECGHDLRAMCHVRAEPGQPR